MKGFTLIELLITLVIIGIVIAIGIPGYNAVRLEGEIETMRTRAIQLQSAKLALIENLGSNQAGAQWLSKANDEARYDDLLKLFLPKEYPANLSDLFPTPYSVNLGAQVDDSVSLSSSVSGSISLQKY